MQYLTTLKIVSGIPEKHGIPAAQAYTVGPFLQGVLMEHLDKAYVSYLHRQPFNPYSQYCYATKDGKEFVWCIHALTSEASEHIIRPMQDMGSFYVKGIDTSFSVRRSVTEAIELKCLTDLIHDDSENRSIITFLTPTSFKSSDSYVLIPSIRLVLQNLLMRYSSIYEGDKEVDEETLQFLERDVRIVSYSLRSQYFPNVSHGYKIPAFMGHVTLRCRGPQPLVGLVRMLLKFGGYAGIGIKTSMGMGGIRCA